MELTKKDKDALVIFDWILRSRVKHNKTSCKESKDQFGVDCFAYNELKFILEEWINTKRKLNLKLKKI